MLTIHHLSVDFEVGGDDTAVFARLFAQHIRDWARRQEDARGRERLLASEASLTGEATGKGLPGRLGGL